MNDANWVIAIFTIVIAVLSFAVHTVYRRIEWLTGAMETHSNWMLRIRAFEGINGEPIEMVWWDPSEGDPPVEKKHGEPVKLDPIYIYLPRELRKKKPAW